MECIDEVSPLRFEALMARVQKNVPKFLQRAINKFKNYCKSFCISQTPLVLHGVRPTSSFFEAEEKPDF